MNKTLKFTLAAAMAVAGVCALVACGDDSGSSVTKKVSDVPEYSKLPKCELKNDAQKAVLDTSDVIYVCKDKNWEVLDTEFVANDSAETLDDIPNCADEQDGNSYYIQKTGVNYICENERWEIVVAKEDSKSSASTAKSSASKGKSSSSVIPGSDPESTGNKDGKSSASTAKSSASTAKSSASKGKSSSSVIPGSDPESTDNKDGKSSASTAKSSASTAKSSSSTAKSSSSVIPGSDPESTGSKDDAKSSDSKSDDAKSSSATAISENEVETFNDLPNCTGSREGLIYFVKKDNASYQCIYNESKSRVWEKVETCGKTTIYTATHFCVDGKSYEKCGTKNYDPAKEFCADKEIYSLCSGKDYNVTLEECVSGKVAYKTIVDSVIITDDGKALFYTVNKTAYMELRFSGDATNPNKYSSCYARGEEMTLGMEDIVASAAGYDMDKATSLEERLYGFFKGGKVTSDLDSCDYFSKVVVYNDFSEIFDHDDFVVLIKNVEKILTKGEGFEGYTAKEGDYKNCVGETESSTLTDIESQFCYGGKVYDRCGGSTFATSKVYNPLNEYCVGGTIAKSLVCGSMVYDPTESFCDTKNEVVKLCGGKTYDTKIATCVDEQIAYVSCTTRSGDGVVVSDGKTATMKFTVLGDFANSEGGCLYLAKEDLATYRTYGASMAAKSKDDVLASHMPLFFMILAGNNIELDPNNCDYYYTIVAKRDYDNEFTEKDVLDNASGFSSAFCAEQAFTMDKSYMTCSLSNPDDGPRTTYTNRETQFCYQGVVYDRCGGSTFATSKVYDAADSSCVDGNVVLKVTAACGSGSYDPETEFCFGGAAYKTDEYSKCMDNSGTLTAVANKTTQFCASGRSYSIDDYEKCSEVIVANKKSGEFCFNSAAYAGKDYEPCKNTEGKVVAVAEKDDQVCYGAEVHQRCGKDHYSLTDETVFCSGTTLYSTTTHGECDGDVYELSNSFCFKVDDDDDGKVYDFCNGGTYTPHEGGSCINGNYYYTADSKTYFEDLRDHNVYKYVKIGAQIWMSNNLNYAADGSICDGGNCSTFGHYYTWATAMDNSCSNTAKCKVSGRVQGVCPDGWHLPSAAEMQTLVNDIGSNLTKYRSTSGWKTGVASSKGNGTDEYGLNLLPSVYISSGNSAIASASAEWSGYLWTTTQRDDSYAATYAQHFYYYVGDNSASVESAKVTKSDYLPVRCIRNAN